MNEKERKRRARTILRAARLELGRQKRDLTEIAGIGRGLAELGAMLVDACEGRYVEHRRGTTTRAVRKALGYIRP